VVHQDDSLAARRRAAIVAAVLFGLIAVSFGPAILREVWWALDPPFGLNLLLTVVVCAIATAVLMLTYRGVVLLMRRLMRRRSG
jgi:hypothetical protein